MSTQVLNISTNRSPLGLSLHRAIDLAAKASSRYSISFFPFLCIVPFVFGNDRNKSVLMFENKKPCLCLPFHFPDPSIYRNFQIWKGEREEVREEVREEEKAHRLSGVLEEPISEAKSRALEKTSLPGEHTGSPSLTFRGRWDQSPGFLDSQERSHLLPQQLERKVAAEHQAPWSERSFWIMHQSPNSSQTPKAQNWTGQPGMLCSSQE